MNTNITDILDEYRSGSTIIILEHQRASADRWGGYTVKTWRRYQSEENARAAFEAAKRAKFRKPKERKK